MPAIAADFLILGATAACGMAIGCLHDLWLVLVLGHQPVPRRHGRRARLPRWGLLPVWLASIAMAWAVLALAADGVVRGAAFIGIAAGLLVYYAVLSRPVRAALGGARRALVAGSRLVLETMTALLAGPAGGLVRFCLWTGRMLAGGGRWVARRAGGIWRRAGPGRNLPPPPPPPPEGR